MTFDDNSTRQHFKGVLVSLVTPNEADWYVYCLRHNLKRKLPIGFLQQATYVVVVQSEEMLFSNRESSEFRRFLFRYMFKLSLSQRYRNVLLAGFPVPLSNAKIRTIFHSAMGLLQF
jgi:hypothetical protein